MRRTKEEAEATRHRLLDAAEALFQSQGVSQTSLQQIAERAGSTRGAVYWHFEDKADLFNAMMDRVILPLEEAGLLPERADADPLRHLREGMREALRRVVHDPQLRRVFDVATHKVEYVGEMGAVHLRHVHSRDVCVLQIHQGLRAAARARGTKLAVPAAQAANMLHALVDGLLHNWLLAPDAFDLELVGGRAIDVLLDGLGLPVKP